MEIPELGTGKTLTREEMEFYRHVKKVNLAVQYVGGMVTNIPQVPDINMNVFSGRQRMMSPTELFEYCMDLAEQVDHALAHLNPENNLKH